MIKTWVNNMRFQIDIVRKLISKLPRLTNMTIRLSGYDFEKSNATILSILQRFINDSPIPVTLESEYPYHAMREKLLTFCGLGKITFDETPTKSLARGPRVYLDRIFGSRFTNHDVRELDLGKLLISDHSISNLAVSCSRLVHLRGRVQRLFDVPSLVLSLAPLKDTLRTIKLLHMPICHRDAHGVIPGQVDLTLFTQLRTVHVPSSAWLRQPACDMQSSSSSGGDPSGFIWRLPDEGRMDIHTSLPPGLENLTISFVWLQAIFARGWSYTQQFRLMPPVTQMRGFDWILALLKTNVKSVKLIEEAGGENLFCMHWGNMCATNFEHEDPRTGKGSVRCGWRGD